jgi:hypothetical protein
MVATTSFSSRVPPQLSIVKKKVEWKYTMKKTQLLLLYSTRVQCSAVLTSAEIDLDCNFLGITPLKSFTKGHEHEMESVLNLISHFKIASV